VGEGQKEARMTDEARLTEDSGPDWSPRSLSEIIGQVQAVRRLQPLIDLSKERGQPLAHILLIGAMGIGKQTLARTLANEMSAGIVTTAGQSIERVGDLMGILTNLNERDVLFIDQVQELPRVVEEYLYLAMEKFAVIFVMDKGLNARTMNIPLRPFTLIGTAQKESELTPRLRSLFPITVVLQPYSQTELSTIAQAFARAHGLSLTPGAAVMIGSFSGGSLVKVRSAVELASRPGASEISEADASKALAILGHQDGSYSYGIPSDLMQLSGTEFEVCVTKLLQRIGFRTELTRATGDGGIDIVAFLDRPIVDGRYLVQCKRFAANIPVGAPIVREFYEGFVADRSAVKGLFITTSNFTTQAREFA
jgi:Holliday junction resolvasome RuvABC ATP-dependent DNA helicase subunit